MAWAVAAAAREVAGAERVGAAAGGDEAQAVGGLAGDEEGELVAVLELEVGTVGEVTADGADPAFLGEDDGDRLLFDQAVGIHFDRVGHVAHDGAAIAERAGAELGADGFELLSDLAPAAGDVAEEGGEFLGFPRERPVFLADLHLLEPAEAAEAHVEDGFGLHVGEGEAGDEGGFGLVFLTDDADDLVEVEEDGEVAFEHFEAPGDGGLAVAAAADEDVLAVVEPVAEHALEAEDHGGAVGGEDVHIEGKAGFELSGAEQRFHEHGRVDGAGFRLEDEADGFGALVADVAEEGQLLFFQKCGDLLDQLVLLHLVGDFSDDDLPNAEAAALDFPAGAHAEAAAAGFVGGEDGGAVLDEGAAGWEIGARHVGQQVRGGGLGVADEVDGGGADFAGVVRRDAAGHADGDAGGAVGEQVGEAAGHDDGLVFLAVVGGAEVDGVVVNAGEEGLGDLRQAGFGVSHGGGVIAVDVPEIALAFDERVAGGEFLGEADEGFVDGGVAVGVVFADDVADGRGRIS